MIHIFSDVSVDPRLKAGFGAYLAITETELGSMDNMENGADMLNSRLRLKQFAATSSTQLEIETILWALQDTLGQQAAVAHITLYTDSQGIIELPRRRPALEQSGFISGATGKALNHADLYRTFYQLQDQLGFKLIKLKGHSKRTDKTPLDRVFSCVDKAARKAMRENRKHT